MKNLFKVTLAAMPLLFATVSQAGSKKAAIKDLSAIRTAARAESLAFDSKTIANFLKIESRGSVYKFHILDQFREKAVLLFKSKLDWPTKDSLKLALNDAFNYYKENPLRFEGPTAEFHKKTFIENQKKLIDKYSAILERLESPKPVTAVKKGDRGKKMGLR